MFKILRITVWLFLLGNIPMNRAYVMDPACSGKRNGDPCETNGLTGICQTWSRTIGPRRLTASGLSGITCVPIAVAEEAALIATEEALATLEFAEAFGY